MKVHKAEQRVTVYIKGDNGSEDTQKRALCGKCLAEVRGRKGHQVRVDESVVHIEACAFCTDRARAVSVA
jgi:hypothetical protein